MDNWAQLENWLQQYAATLTPPARKKLMMAIMRELRRANAQRIGANVDPDGAKFEPRKPRKEKAKRTPGGKAMFRKLRLARNMKIKADSDEGELGFGNPLVGITAAEHHYGLEGRVGKTRDGRTIRTRYAERRLMGFGPDDMRRIMDAAIDHIGK
jgi:phage virion morphogenesis protein